MSTRPRLIALLALLIGLIPVGVQAAQARHGHGGTRPYMRKQPNPSIFGIDTGTYDSVHGHYPRDFGAARSLGARWDRFTLNKLATVDDEVKRARQHGMGVVLSFAGIPQACSERSLRSNVGRCPPTTTGDLHRYQSYVREILLRYRNVVTYYESWREINHNTSILNAAQYARLLQAQYDVFRSVNRRYHLRLKLLYGSEMGFSIKPGSNHWEAVIPFTRQVLDDLNGAKPFDGVALHGYRFPPGRDGPSAKACDYVGGVSVSPGSSSSRCPAPNWRLLTWPEELTAYEQEFASHGYGQVPLWLTEFGWPAGGNCGSLPAGYCVATGTQDAYLKQAYADLLQLPFVQGALWFNLRDYKPGMVTPDPPFFYHYGLLEYGYGEKPAGRDFKALVRANPGR
jgi:hypothetical protein